MSAKHLRITWLFALVLTLTFTVLAAQTDTSAAPSAPATQSPPAAPSAQGPTGAITPEEEAILAADTPPEIPTGFETEQEVLGAVIAGKLHLLSPTMPMPLPGGVVETKGIEYGRVGDRALQLDLYMPENLDKPRPGLIFIHGGGWQSGDRSDYKYYTMRYAKRGYVVATISYRFAKEAPFPACVQDAKCAVRWMRANAAKYHVDPNKIAVLGGSAGGHLSMMVGYSSDVAELEGDGGNPGVSSAVQAVVDIYGPVDITVPEARTHPIVLNFFAGKTYEEIPDQYALASPLTHLDKADPPTLILQGSIDALVPQIQSDTLAAKLKELGIPYEYVVLDGYPHAMDISQEANTFCQWHINRFLKKYLPITE